MVPSDDFRGRDGPFQHRDEPERPETPEPRHQTHEHEDAWSHDSHLFRTFEDEILLRCAQAIEHSAARRFDP